MKLFYNLTAKERNHFERLNTPIKIQNFLNSIPINFEDTFLSPVRVIEEKRAHCLEGALFAAAALYYHKREPIILDLITSHKDESHVVALFREGDKWGAISKTNHAVLRYRDAVYRDPEEIVMSYFNEYFLDSGEKTLQQWAVFDLGEIRENWVTDREEIWYVDKALDRIKHKKILSGKSERALRNADEIERKAGKIVEWKKPNKNRT